MTMSDKEPRVDDDGISEEVRKFCFERDHYKCRKCGCEEDLALHHVIYRSLGGGHDPTNLIVLCMKCHGRVHRKELYPKWIDGVWMFIDKKSWRYEYAKNLKRSL